jgi:AcrR family transcriptional regulator
MPDDQAPRRSRDPEHTRRAILDAAIAEFAEKGFAARVDTSPPAPAPPSG